MPQQLKKQGIKTSEFANIPLAMFDKAIAGRRFAPRTKEIGRDLLVRGMQIEDVAKKYNLHPSRIYNIRASFLPLMEQPQKKCAKWEIKQVCAPTEMLDHFVKEVENERKS
jgi:Mor family transcriptional regulator